MNKNTLLAVLGVQAWAKWFGRSECTNLKPWVNPKNGIDSVGFEIVVQCCVNLYTPLHTHKEQAVKLFALLLLRYPVSTSCIHSLFSPNCRQYRFDCCVLYRQASTIRCFLKDERQQHGPTQSSVHFRTFLERFYRYVRNPLCLCPGRFRPLSKPRTITVL